MGLAFLLSTVYSAVGCWAMYKGSIVILGFDQSLGTADQFNWSIKETVVKRVELYEKMEKVQLN